MNQEIIRKHTTKELIGEIEKIVTEPISDWVIGVGGRLDDGGCLSTIVFNPNNSSAVVSAYKHFSRLGMAAKEPVPTETKFLYLFNKNWETNAEPIF
jgi:hypothetical protein